MKLLSIGNSFSQDAHRWLNDVAKKNGIDLHNVNLYIGGCSLETHHRLMNGEEAHYDNEIKATPIGKISLKEALQNEKWDIITFQQQSGASGRAETYQPYLNELSSFVRMLQPTAKFYIHQTWAYEPTFVFAAFEHYNNSFELMHQKLSECYLSAANSINAELIPVGEVINRLRTTTSEFSLKDNGVALTRDGFHLSLDYGRYAAALTWCAVIFGIDPTKDTFVPIIGDKKSDESLLDVIRKTVSEVLGK